VATVEGTFTPLPAHVRTARLVATAVARRSGVDESLLDEARIAVGEACSRAVEAHRRHCPAEPGRVGRTDRAQGSGVPVSAPPPPPPARRPAPASDGGTPDGGARHGGIRDGDTADDGDSDDDGYEAFGPDGGSGAIPAGFGLALISGLAEDVRVLSTSSGVSIRMSWASAAASS